MLCANKQIHLLVYGFFKGHEVLSNLSKNPDVVLLYRLSETSLHMNGFYNVCAMIAAVTYTIKRMRNDDTGFVCQFYAKKVINVLLIMKTGKKVNFVSFLFDYIVD